MERLRQFMIKRRERLDLTQRQLAVAASIQHGTIGAIEAGKVSKAPAIQTLDAIAIGLRVDPDLLVNIVRGKVGTSEDEIAQLARDGKVAGKGRAAAAALNIPGVVTGDRMDEITHAKPWFPWEDDTPAPLPWVAVVGEVGCGQLRLEDPDRATRKFPVPERYAKAAAYAVIARGDSLNALGPPRAPINDGDLLLVRKVREPEHGMVVVAYVPEEGATAKVYQRKAGIASLRPWSTNPEHETIAVDGRVQIVGEVFAVLPAPRDLEAE